MQLQYKHYIFSNLLYFFQYKPGALFQPRVSDYETADEWRIDPPVPDQEDVIGNSEKTAEMVAAPEPEQPYLYVDND